MKNKRSAVRATFDRKKKSSTAKYLNSEISNVQPSKLCNTRITVVPSKCNIDKNTFKMKQRGSKTINKQFDNSATARGKKRSSLKKFTQPLNNGLYEAHSSAFSNEDSGTSFNTRDFVVDKDRRSFDDNKGMNDLIESNSDSDDNDSKNSVTFEVKDADDFIDGEDDEVADQNNDSELLQWRMHSCFHLKSDFLFCPLASYMLLNRFDIFHR